MPETTPCDSLQREVWPGCPWAGRPPSCRGPLLQPRKRQPRGLVVKASELVFSRPELSLFLAGLAKHRRTGCWASRRSPEKAGGT